MVPNNKVNATIKKVIDNANASIDEIWKLEEYFKKYEQNDSEKEKLNELIVLKDKLKNIAEIGYFKTPNN